MLISIDPGPKESAYCLFENGKPKAWGKVDNKVLLGYLDGGYDFMAIEMIASYGMAVGQTVFDTCVFIGRCIEAHKGLYKYVYRKDVKMHLCGSMRAKDTNIRQALIDRFGKPGTKKNPGKLYGMTKDCWSALGVGLTAIEAVPFLGETANQMQETGMR